MLQPFCVYMTGSEQTTADNGGAGVKCGILQREGKRNCRG